jgi:hypothetical protein
MLKCFFLLSFNGVCVLRDVWNDVAFSLNYVSMAYAYSDLILYILIPEARCFLKKNSADPGTAKYRYYDKFRML